MVYLFAAGLLASFPMKPRQMMQTQPRVESGEVESDLPFVNTRAYKNTYGLTDVLPSQRTTDLRHGPAESPMFMVPYS